VIVVVVEVLVFEVFVNGFSDEVCWVIDDFVCCISDDAVGSSNVVRSSIRFTYSRGASGPESRKAHPSGNDVSSQKEELLFAQKK
jgi:hypothetical protein